MTARAYHTLVLRFSLSASLNQFLYPSRFTHAFCVRRGRAGETVFASTHTENDRFRNPRKARSRAILRKRVRRNRYQCIVTIIIVVCRFFAHLTRADACIGRPY